MTLLAELSPPLEHLRRRLLPITRDQLMLLMAAINELFLGIDTYLAHNISGTIRPFEWIPIIFGPVAAALLLLAGLIALRRRPLASSVASVVLLASIVVGLLGAFFHWRRALLPNALPGEQISVDLLVWAPPILGPLTFSLTGLLGLSAAWVEQPPDSGVLLLTGRRKLALPYSKTQAYFFMVSMGSLATVISSVLDHARTGFVNPWLWLPTAVGGFATVVAAYIGALEGRRRADVAVFTAAMVLMIAVGVVGGVLHVLDDLTAAGAFVAERFIRGAPFLAPLLFANMGSLGLFVLMGPEDGKALGRRATDGAARAPNPLRPASIPTAPGMPIRQA